jgi:hypothetical protein
MVKRARVQESGTCSREQNGSFLRDFQEALHNPGT